MQHSEEFVNLLYFNINSFHSSSYFETDVVWLCETWLDSGIDEKESCRRRKDYSFADLKYWMEILMLYRQCACSSR